MKRRVVLPAQTAPVPVLDRKVDVIGPVRDPDNRPVKIGTIVKRDGYVHPLYGPMKKIHGQVVRIYTLPGKDGIYLDVIEKKSRQIRPMKLEQMSRSSSKAFKGRKRA